MFRTTSLISKVAASRLLLTARTRRLVPAAFIQRSYHDHHQRSLASKETFWAELAEEIDWFEPPPAATILSLDQNNIHRWFAGGKLNTSYLTADVHVDKYNHGDVPAILWDSPMIGRKEKITYRQLRDQVAHFAGILASQGVEKGDRVMIYMPMIPQAIVAMLAIARLGAVHSVVFGGFAAKEIVTRINDLHPKVLVTANYGIEGSKVIDYKKMVDEALAGTEHAPKKVIVYKREEKEVPHQMQSGRDYYWQDLAKATSVRAGPVIVDATDPLYVLYTSGTTGPPKGIIRDHGGHAVVLKYTMRAIFDTHEKEVFFAASDIGWVVGHSYCVYGPLLKGATTLIYEGKPVKTPDAGAFWRLIEEYKVKSLFAAPTAARAIRKEDPEASLMKNYDVSSLKNYFLAGERLDSDTFRWIQKILPNVNIGDNFWMTETGAPIVANPLGLKKFPPKSGSATVAMPGYDIRILDDEGHEVERGEIGNVVAKLPLPPGCFPSIYGNHQRKVDAYLKEFPSYFATGDMGMIDDEGYIFIMGRSDDVLNVAGHRLSGSRMEEIVASHPAVAEAAVIGVPDELKGEVPHAFVMLQDGSTIDPKQLEKELVAAVREEIGAVASFRRATIVTRLPKTRSGKILRKTMKKLTESSDVPTPATIDDVSALDELKLIYEEERIGPLYNKEGKGTNVAASA